MNVEHIIQYHIKSAKSYHQKYIMKKRRSNPLASHYKKWRDDHLSMARYVKSMDEQMKKHEIR